MKKLLILLAMAAMACNNQVKTDQQTDSHENHDTKKEEALSLNNDKKWNADEATLNNVNAMMVVINDSSYAATSSRSSFINQMQNRIDTLVSQCRMQGPDHDALHLWLNKVTKNMKEIKEEDDEYEKEKEKLKNNIESFYTYFE